ncbi:uncharacterized protein [Diadema setosum]|uniref:uncharacterized protein n=1 Tax=Diadema setosum TaxID=31175 RepID=UPI003B3AE479
MAANSFHAEILSKSITELQQEKDRYEQKLRDMKNKRKVLEKKYETDVLKFKQTDEKRSKMTETVRIAQHKVTQSQSELDSQQTANNQLQAKIRHIEESIQAKDDAQNKELEAYEEKLSDLVDQFQRARHFYTDESLLSEISLMKQKEQELEQETVNVKVESERVSEAFQELSKTLEQRKEAEEREGFTVATQKEIISMLTAENQESEKALNDLKERKAQIDEELKNLRDWFPPEDARIEE